MPRFFTTTKLGPKRSERKARTTAISFSAEDLRELGHRVAVGQSVLQTAHPVVARLKAAMTQMKVPVPKGL